MADVIVAGAGPAGAAVALTMARAGADVTLVERAQFPRRKVCGEYLSAGALALLDELGVGAAVRSAGVALNGVRLSVAGAKPLELPFERPALALERAHLDQLLLDAALAAGAHLVRARVERLARRDDRVCGVEVRNDDGVFTTLNARHVVGADGSGSLVARALGVSLPARGRKRFALGGHYRRSATSASSVEMFVGGGAYVAINPLEGQRANVMVIVKDATLRRWQPDVDTAMHAKIVELAGAQNALSLGEREGARVAFGPLAFGVRSAVRAGAVLVGDAGGFVDPFTGQGVFLALHSARAAAHALVESLRAPGRTEAALAAYASARRHDLALRRRLAHVVALLVDVPLLGRRASRRIAQTPERASALLAALAGIGSAENALAPQRLLRLVV